MNIKPHCGASGAWRYNVDACTYCAYLFFLLANYCDVISFDIVFQYQTKLRENVVYLFSQSRCRILVFALRHANKVVKWKTGVSTLLRYCKKHVM